MTDFVWTGATDENFETAGNWDQESGYPDGSADRAIFSGTPTNDCETSGETHSVNIGELCVMPDYTGAIGAAGSPLIIGADFTQIDASSASTINIEGVTDYIQDHVTIQGTGGSNTVYIGGLITDLSIIRGNVEINDGSEITGKFYIGYENSQNADVTLTIQDSDGSSTTLPDTYVGGGIIINYAAIPNGKTLYLDAGKWTHGQDHENDDACGAIATIRQKGGIFEWNKGNITNAFFYNGSVDASNGRLAARTIGTTYVVGPVDFNFDNGRANLNDTKVMKFFTGGSTFRFPAGMKITIGTV